MKKGKKINFLITYSIAWVEFISRHTNMFKHNIPYLIIINNNVDRGEL